MPTTAPSLYIFSFLQSSGIEQAARLLSNNSNNTHTHARPLLAFSAIRHTQCVCVCVCYCYKRRAAGERVSLLAGFLGQTTACRLGKHQSKWLCSAVGSLTSDVHQRLVHLTVAGEPDHSKTSCTSNGQSASQAAPGPPAPARPPPKSVLVHLKKMGTPRVRLQEHHVTLKTLQEALFRRENVPLSMHGCMQSMAIKQHGFWERPCMAPYFCGASAHIGLFEEPRTSVSGAPRTQILRQQLPSAEYLE